MKNNFFFVLCCFLLCSCNSISKQNYYKAVNVPVRYIVEVRNVKVNSDYIECKDAEIQVQQNMQIMFASYEQAVDLSNESSTVFDKQTAYLDITITQRSFIKDIETRNSIYVCSSVIDKQESVLVQNCFNIETKNTIISSYEQNKLCQQIFSEIEKFLEKAYKH